MDPAQLDLNILVALHALLEEEGVSRAALRLGVTQPALSRSLARLRTLFSDPLLVRRGNTMVLTPMAKGLRTPVAKVMADVQSLITPASFHPKTDTTRWNIACSEYSAGVVMPPFIHSLGHEAPAMDVTLQSWRAVEVDDLASEKLDFGIGSLKRKLNGICRRHLFTDRYVCIVDKKHHKAYANQSPADFAALPHVLVTVTDQGSGAVDTALRKRGLQRRLAIKTPHFQLAPGFVEHSELILTLPQRAFEPVRSLYPRLRTIAPPLELPTLRVSLFWHERQHNHAPHRFVRSLISEACKDSKPAHNPE